MTKFKPTNNRLLVRREPSNDKVGSVYLPDNAQGSRPFGVVVAVDETAGYMIQPGDRIVFGEYAGSAIDIDGEALLILDAKDVLGVLEDSE
jgi:chaperonin GroES